MTAGVNKAMVRPLHAESAQVGAETWVTLDDVSGFVAGQKIDFAGETGVSVTKADSKSQPLSGTYLVATTDEAGKRVKFMDAPSIGSRSPARGRSTLRRRRCRLYKLVGPQYFNFFALMMACVGLLFIFVAMLYRERTHLRDEGAGAAA